MDNHSELIQVVFLKTKSKCFVLGTFGLHDFEDTRAVLPTKLGIDTHGPFSGTDATGCPDQVSSVFMKSNHTPKQWHQNNYNKYYQAFEDRENSEKTRSVRLLRSLLSKLKWKNNGSTFISPRTAFMIRNC